MRKNIRLHEPPPEAYPIVMRAFLPNGDQVWSRTAEGPGVMIEVPPLRRIHQVEKIEIRVEYADGTYWDSRE